MFIGAEAVVDIRENNVKKTRLKKSYRIDEIDNLLRRQRTKREAKLLAEACRQGVAVPRVLEEQAYDIILEKIDGAMVKEVLDKNANSLCRKIGESVARLHSAGIIHGDLTTSNMLVNNNGLYLIDFGLGFMSQKPEDKATDLHVLHETLASTHPGVKNAWKIVLKAYVKNYNGSSRVLSSLNNIEKRGRYVKRDNKRDEY
jgi:TP53 regulating kinase-like protein